MLAERAYAKINLTLDVLGKRADGYHEVDMVMQTVDLSDLLWLEETPGSDVTVESNASHIPSDARNLAVVAAKAFQQASGIHRGVKIRIDKQIPVAAGLAGGSADAAAVLRGLNRLWSTNYSEAELAQIGASVGSDVPFCVYGGCAIARGRGEEIRPVHHPMKVWTVLVRPGVFVSTADAYGALSSSNYARAPKSQAMVTALQAGDFEGILSLVSNSLAPVTFTSYPEVQHIHEKVQQVSKTHVFMSGSGPTLFCLMPSHGAGQRLYNALRGFMKEVYLCRWI